MSAPDCFLVAWWVLATAVSIPTVILVRRQNLLDRQRAVLSYLKGDPFGWYSAWQGMQMPGPVQLAVLISSVLLVVGGLVLFFMRDWTRLLLLNSQIFMVIVGGCVAMVGLSAAAFARARSDWMKAVPHLMRTLFALLGIAIVAAGGMAAIKDIALPRLVVEGRVDSVDAYRKRLVDTDYFVVIDGKRFQSTFEAFVHIHPARQVRVEVGAGSGVILAAGDNERRAISRPGRN